MLPKVVLEIVGVPPGLSVQRKFVLVTTRTSKGHLRGPGDSWILPKHSFERTLPWHDDDETWHQTQLAQCSIRPTFDHVCCVRLLSAASMPMQDFRQTLPMLLFFRMP